MAATLMASMPSLAFATAAGGARRAGVFPASSAVLAPPRRRALVVRAQSEDPTEPTPETTTTTTASTTTSTSSSPSSPAAATATPTPSSKPAWASILRDALAFINGPAPERINGRAAMVGFVASLAVEALRGGGDGADLLSQASCGTGIACFVATAAVLTVASLVPLLNGDDDSAEDDQSGGGGVMSADAELWNGRLAMLGILALAVTEYLTGVPFVTEIIGALS